MGKIGCIIQARMGSTRLPGKVMKDLEGEPVLYHVIERVKQSELIDEIIIATTTHERDDVIVEEAKRNDVKYYRGSEEDVLSRYLEASKKYGIDIIVRITSDCPLIDPVIIDEIINHYKENNYKLVTNAGIDVEMRTFPRGMDTEVFSLKLLEKVFDEATKQYHKEHVTAYIYENYSDEIFYFQNSTDYSDYRLTLDTHEDFELIERIYQELYNGTHDFYIKEIIELLEEKPELASINKKVEQKKVSNE